MSERIELDKGMGKNAQKLLQDRLEKCREALETEDKHVAVHDARKQLKKLRAVTRLFRSEIGEKCYQMTNVYYRDIGYKLSEARDAAAMLETLNSLQDSVNQDLCGVAFQEIKQHLSARKSAVSRILLNQKNLLDNVTNDLQRAESIHKTWKIKKEGFDAVHGGLHKTYSRCQKAMKNAYKQETPEAFHEWRKRTKYLRYQIDFLQEIWHTPLNALEDELHQLTDYLGDDHDLHVLKEYISGMETEHQDAVTALLALIDERRAALQKAAHPLGKKLLYDDPDQFVGRLAYYWKQSLKENKILQDEEVMS